MGLTTWSSTLCETVPTRVWRCLSVSMCVVKLAHFQNWKGIMVPARRGDAILFFRCAQSLCQFRIICTLIMQSKSGWKIRYIVHTDWFDSGFEKWNTSQIGVRLALLWCLQPLPTLVSGTVDEQIRHFIFLLERRWSRGAHGFSWGSEPRFIPI